MKDIAGLGAPCGNLEVGTLRLKVGFRATCVASLYVSCRWEGYVGRD